MFLSPTITSHDYCYLSISGARTVIVLKQHPPLTSPHLPEPSPEGAGAAINRGFINRPSPQESQTHIDHRGRTDHPLRGGQDRVSRLGSNQCNHHLTTLTNQCRSITNFKLIRVVFNIV
jgi:hypothetical protein